VVNNQVSTALTTWASPVLVPREDPVGKLVFVVTALAIGVVCFLALMLFLRAVLPGFHRRAREALVVRPWKTLLLGLLAYSILGSAAAWLFSKAFVRLLLTTVVVPGKLVAASTVTAVLLVLTFLGAPAVVSLVGKRGLVLGGRPSSELRETLWGGLLSVLASFFPGIGWVLVMPGLLLFSCGAGLQSLPWKRGATG
jgi:hypothetical protein